MATTFEIHPAIAVARVGDSVAPDGFFLAPEPGGAPPASYRDGAGHLKRQAARFRLFQCERDANNHLTAAAELTMATAQIQWTVQLANRKACSIRLVGQGRRNNASGDDDPTLAIKPTAKTLGAPNSTAAFDDGKFRGTVVPLGEMRTGADGSLLILGGHGKAESVPTGAGLPDFADNDGWHDDISDGPISATVTVGGIAHPVKTAWVVVAPPDFAPGIDSIVTWYDVAMQAAVDRGFRAVAAQPSFQQDILPILNRFVRLQWTNPLFRQMFGPGSTRDFASKFAALADPAKEQQTRLSFLNALRKPGALPNPGITHIPPLNDDRNDGDSIMLTPLQFAVMQAWANNNFRSDFGAPPPAGELLPDALDRVSLQACVGGAFFPGIEAGHLISDKTLYSEAFRLDAAKLKAGQLTEGNAVPWQADFSACRTDSALAWWPAQRPDNVFIDPAQVGSVAGMKRWLAGVNGVDGASGLITNFGKLGIVKQETGPGGQTVFIERERKLPPR